MVSIFLAEDHEVVRKGIREMLQQECHEWKICGETGNGRDAVRLIMQLSPDIAVLDLCLPEMNGIEITRQIKKAYPQLEILIYSVHISEHLICQSLDAGAHSYLLKTDSGRCLVEAIDALSRHKPLFTTRARKALLNNSLTPTSYMPGQSLTAREREVLQLLAEGRANKEIALMLCLSVKTVETHRAAIKRKLGIRSLAWLVRYAIRNHLVKP